MDEAPVYEDPFLGFIPGKNPTASRNDLIYVQQEDGLESREGVSDVSQGYIGEHKKDGSKRSTFQNGASTIDQSSNNSKIVPNQ